MEGASRNSEVVPGTDLDWTLRMDQIRRHKVGKGQGNHKTQCYPKLSKLRIREGEVGRGREDQRPAILGLCSENEQVVRGWCKTGFEDDIKSTLSVALHKYRLFTPSQIWLIACSPILR